MNDFYYQRRYRGPLKAVIFDWAGTTLDYGCMAPTAVFLEVFKRQGVEISSAEARGPMGTHKREHLLQVLALPRVAKRWQEVHGRVPGAAEADALFTNFMPLQLATLAEHAELIPGTLEAVDYCTKAGLRIASTTGYTAEMMKVLTPLAAERGYQPEVVVAASDVAEARPAPWMCLLAAQRLGVYPLESIVKVGDTVADIGEGLNAGMWTVGVVQTGNELGLTRAEVERLPASELDVLLSRGRRHLQEAGSHYVIDGLWQLKEVITSISARLQRGEKP